MNRSSFLLTAALCAPFAWSQTTNPPAPSTAPAQAPAQTAPANAPPPPPSASGLRSRGPEAIAAQTPDKVVATIGGKPITAKQAADLLKPLRPEDRKRFESDVPKLVQQIYLETQLADKATEMKLDTQTPWKEQLDISRANILTQAYLSKMSAQAPGQDPKAYYDAHLADYDQIKLSGILIGFSPPGTPASSPGVHRTDAQAQEKANDLSKKIKSGGDFSALARTDSDNQQSSARGGELGTVTLADQQLPADVKQVVSTMQTGQVSEPVRVNNGFYIFKVDNRSKLPFEQVRTSIVQKLQNEKAQDILKSELEKYKVDVQDPEFFNTSTTPSLRVPSLQRPSSNGSSAPPPGQPK